MGAATAAGAGPWVPEGRGIGLAGADVIDEPRAGGVARPGLVDAARGELGGTDVLDACAAGFEGAAVV